VTGPAYHLRTNKAADRFALIEAIRRLPRLGVDLEEYTYYGLGGAYLEDIRLLYEYCPEIKMVSIEGSPDIYQRQKFHQPCGTLKLENCDMRSYIGQYEPNDAKSIFWLDYTELRYGCVDDFIALLDKVIAGSMVKITLRADPRDYWNKPADIRRRKAEEFRGEFRLVLPKQSARLPREFGRFAYMVQEMLRIAAQRALSAQTTQLAFQPVSSFYYSDGTWMFTLTGVVWPRNGHGAIERAYRNWEFANLTWGRPRLIDIPDLSTKERLHLQQFLPCGAPRGATLHSELGHLVEEDVPKTEEALEQYAAFHRYFPYFLRGVP